jgi:DNA-binding transcriptional ArsR family regulator
MRSLRHPRLDDLDLTDVLRALSDPARVAIVKALLVSGRPLTCGEITCDKPKSSMSHHFKALRDAGILETRVAGKEHLNQLRTTELEERFPGLARAIFRLVLAEDGLRPQPAMERRRRGRKSRQA